MTHIRRVTHGIGTVLIPIALVLAACSGPEVEVSSAADDQQAEAAAEDTTEDETTGDVDDVSDADERADTGAQEPKPSPEPSAEPAPTADKPATGDTDETDKSDEPDTPAPRRVTTYGFDGSTDCDATTSKSPGAYFVAPNDGAAVGSGPVKVEFVGCSDTFEANVVYEAYHGQNSQPTLSGYTMGGTLGDWAEFRFTETFWTPGRWRVVLQEIDAESGDLRRYDEVTFTVAP